MKVEVIMDTKIFTDIAQEITSYFKESIIFFYITQSVLVFLAVWLNSYLSTKGKNFATKTDFDSLKEQLAINTRVTEEIKTSISHEDWQKREYKLLMKQKLEELLFAIHEVEEWLSYFRDVFLFSEEINKKNSPIFKIEVLSCLYFKDLNTEFRNYKALYSVLIAGLYKAKQELLILKGNSNAIENNVTIEEKMKIIDNASKEYQKVFIDFHNAQSKIENKAADIMSELLNQKL